MPPDVFVDADRGHAVEAGRIIDQDALAFGEDRVVRDMPGHVERFGDASDREVLADDRFQRPPDRCSGESAARLRRGAGVFAPDRPAVVTAKPADADKERCRTPAERDMREPPRLCPARDALAAATATERVPVGDAALQHRTVGSDLLAGDGEAVVVEDAERGQVRGSEGSVVHRRGLPDGRCENFHHRKASTSSQRPPCRRRHQPTTTPSSAKSP